jgi:hypothetical protein
MATKKQLKSRTISKREGEAKPHNLQAKRVKQSRMISKREGEAKPHDLQAGG